MHLSAAVHLKLRPYMLIICHYLSVHPGQGHPLVPLLEVLELQVLRLHDVVPPLQIVPPVVDPGHMRLCHHLREGNCIFSG